MKISLIEWIALALAAWFGYYTISIASSTMEAIAEMITRITP